MDSTNIGCDYKAMGLTLPELLIAIVLLGILLSWGAPNFIELYQRNALTTEANRLLTHLMHTRSEAIKRNLPTVICRSEDGISCVASTRARTDWGMGWLIFANSDKDKLRDETEPVIAVGARLHPALSLNFNQWWRLTFQPTGRTANGTFVLCSQNGDARLITVYRSGRFRLSNPQREGSTNPCPPS